MVCFRYIIVNSLHKGGGGGGDDGDGDGDGDDDDDDDDDDGGYISAEQKLIKWHQILLLFAVYKISFIV